MRAASSSDDETIEHNNFKLVLLGAEAVGKTALIRQLVHNCLDASYIATVGAEVYKAEVQITPAVHATLQVWDVGSSVSSLDMAAHYLHGCDAVLAVYDVRQPQSQAAACQWLEVLCQMFEGHGMPYVAVVANKADTDPWKARATQLQANLPPDISCYSYIVSAESSSDVKQLFVSVAADLAGNPLQPPPQQPDQQVMMSCGLTSSYDGNSSRLCSQQPHNVIQATLASSTQPWSPARSCCNLDCRNNDGTDRSCCCWFGCLAAARGGPA